MDSAKLAKIFFMKPNKLKNLLQVIHQVANNK